MPKIDGMCQVVGHDFKKTPDPPRLVEVGSDNGPMQKGTIAYKSYRCFRCNKQIDEEILYSFRPNTVSD